jgi:Maltose acetyltransferase
MLGVTKIDGTSEKQKMLRGELYNANDRELVAERRHAESQLALLNGGGDLEECEALLRILLCQLRQHLCRPCCASFSYGEFARIRIHFNDKHGW